jgi:hypothetical protein
MRASAIRTPIARTNQKGRCVMKKLIAAVALASVIAAPALAQSYDPSVGSGNIAGQVTVNHPLSAYARELPVPTGRGAAPHAARPFTATEKAFFDRIPIE